jgi:hypothetical protein
MNGPTVHLFAWLIVAVVRRFVVSSFFSEFLMYQDGTTQGPFILPMINCNILWHYLLHIEHWLHEWDLRRAIFTLCNGSDWYVRRKTTVCITLYFSVLFRKSCTPRNWSLGHRQQLQMFLSDCMLIYMRRDQKHNICNSCRRQRHQHAIEVRSRRENCVFHVKFV